MSLPLPSECIKEIVQALYDKKGSNILVLDVRNICSMADFFIVAEGTVAQHVKALASYLIETTKPLCGAPKHVNGQQYADWMVLDYGDLVIHLFIPELRQYYALEQLWREGKIVDVPINIKEEQ